MMQVLNRLKHKKRHEFAFYIKFAIIRLVTIVGTSGDWFFEFYRYWFRNLL